MQSVYLKRFARFHLSELSRILSGLLYVKRLLDLLGIFQAA